MNPRRSLQIQGLRWCVAALLALFTSPSMLHAAEAEPPAPPPAASTNAPAAVEPGKEAAAEEAPAAMTPEQIFEGGTNAFNNWVEFSAGGFMTSGNRAAFEQQHQTSSGAFGGIESLHVQGDIAKGTTFTVDGRSIFDNHDYDLTLGVAREKLGYLRFNFNEFRTWSDADGGYYRPTDAFFGLSDDALTLDRGSISFEGGLSLDKLPKVTFKYTHQYREGEKGSTRWGATHPDPNDTGLVRGIVPSFYDIDESRDIFQLDVTHQIKATGFGVGVRYETGDLNNAAKLHQWPGEPLERRITDEQDNSYDLFSVHGFSETWIKKNLMLSAGLSYSDLDNDFSGSRIYGSDFDVNYVPAAQNLLGYYNLSGGSRLQEYVGNLNLFYQPAPAISIVPSIRIMKEDSDTDVSGLGTFSDLAEVPFGVDSSRGVLDVRERLDVRYTGITNWVLFARGEWTQGDGDLEETGGLTRLAAAGIDPISRQTDDTRFFQKYSAGARWYISRKVILDGGGYYKLNDYDYDHDLDSTLNDSTDRYPAYFVMQDFETYDANVRLTLRPRPNLSFVTRYEYQISSIHTTPDPISGLGEVEASDMTSHIFAEDISWVPWSRLSFQAGLNYVVSETETPASHFIAPGQTTASILDAQNNYWTLNLSSGLVLDSRTDLRLAYFYYLADNFEDNFEAGLPLGAGGQEHAITATLVRRLTDRIRVSLRYGYLTYNDETYGGNSDFDAHLVYSSLQYRF